MAEHDEDNVNLALLAHDLRTPLGAMRLAAELIGNGPLNETQKDQLNTLLKAVDALDQMTGELIVQAEPDQHTKDKAVPISSVVCECADLFQMAAASKGLKLKIRLQEPAANALTLHSGPLRRAISALLDNAIKYTDAGRVTVELVSCPEPANTKKISAKKQNGGDSSFWVSIAIADTGPGIDPKERANVFQPFVRGKEVSGQASGSGLGLWGTMQTVREMNGALSLSTPPNGGCRFDIQIPVDYPPAAMVDGEDLVSSAGDEEIVLPEHVLIVDDNDTNCRLLAALLECYGVSSDIANSGEQAISCVDDTDYDAVLLDLNMPGMSGVETAQALQAMRPAQELPLIAVTAAMEAFGDKRLREAGFLEVLAKPLSPSALHEALVQARRSKNVYWI